MPIAVKWSKCSASDFADLIGVSQQAVSEWISAGMPCKRAGRGHRVAIDPPKAIPWVISRREPAGSQRERLAAEQADKVALENAAKRGETILAGHVAEVLSTLAADLAARQDAVPGRLASELAGINDPAVIRQRLLVELRSVRGAFAAAIDKLSDALGAAEDDGGDSEATAEPDRQRVGRRKPRTATRKRRARAVPK